MTDRTSSGPAGTPQATRSVWTRRYPYVPPESSNDFLEHYSKPQLIEKKKSPRAASNESR
jgi:hypothetical protein